MEKAVIDRIVDGEVAVLLVGENEEEFTVKVEQLPDDAKEGTHLFVDIRDGVVEEMTIAEAETISAKERIQSKMERLRKKKKK